MNRLSAKATIVIEDLERQLAEAKTILSDLPDHSDLDAAVFEANALRAENARLQERVKEAEAHDCGYALQRTLEIAERQMALAERRKKALELGCEHGKVMTGPQLLDWIANKLIELGTTEGVGPLRAKADAERAAIEEAP